MIESPDMLVMYMTRLKRTTEDYLKAIFVLTKQSGSVRSVRIAEHLGVTKPERHRTIAELGG